MSTKNQTKSLAIQNPFSKKQLQSYTESTRRLNFWDGAVRSGKTFISIVRLMKLLKDGPKGLAMIVGVSRDAIQRNVLIELCDLVGAPVPTPKSTQMNLFGRTIFLVGASDESAQRRIRGSTLAIAYVDEITLIPHGFFKMLLSRLSQPRAMMLGCTNPDSPFHWLKTEYFNRTDLDMVIFHFRLEDNPSLSKHYVENLKLEYSGLWYKRFIEGQWVLAEGCVYDFFDEDDHVILEAPGPAEYYIVSIDYGTTNPTVFSLIGYNPKFWPNVWLEREYYYDSKAKGRQKTDSEYAEDLIAFCRNKLVTAIYVDPSAASFKAEMRKQGLSGIMDADNDVLNGIRFVSKMLSNGTLKICGCCTNTVREFQSYRWDEKATQKGIDKPIKEFDHCFVSGTLVETENGPREIQEIQKGDYVSTRSGKNKVLETFVHEAEVISKNILGVNFQATPGHLFLTQNGWKSLKSLMPCDMLFTKLEAFSWWKKSNLKEEFTDDIQILLTLVSENTIKQMDQKLQKDFDIYIETFGAQGMGKFHPNTIFITKTEIHSTTTLAISNVFQLQNTIRFTRKIFQKIKEKKEENTLKGLDLSLKHGIEAKKVETGIESTLRQASKEKIESLHVSNVPKSSLLENRPTLDFVRITVSQNGEEIITLMMRKETALDAMQNSQQINIAKANIAEFRAEESIIGKRKVYNLHVENEHEFFAEGILVHNCMDSIRYGIFTHFRNKFSSDYSSKDIEDIAAKVYNSDSDLPEFFQGIGNEWGR